MKTMLTTLALAVLLLSVTGPVAGQELVLTGANVLDVGSGEAWPGATIRIRDGRITAVERGMEAVGSADGVAEGVELGDRWVIPGLVDMHVHLGIVGAPGIAPQVSTTYKALIAYRNAYSLLEHGFTTVRNVGGQGYAEADLARAIEFGLLTGPNIIDAGKSIIPFGMKASVTQGPHRHPIPVETGPVWESSHEMVTGPWQMVEAVRRNIYYGAKVIKLVADMNPYSFTEAELRAAVDEAHAAGVTVAVHVGYGGEPARRAILAGADTIEHGFGLDDDLLRLMKEQGTALSTTDFPWGLLLNIFDGNEAPALEWDAKITRRLERAHELGVKLVFGTDAIMQVPGRSRGEITISFIDKWLDVGIPPLDLLRAMTVTAYEVLGLSEEYGQIAPGYVADLVVLEQDPRLHPATLKKPYAVFRDGRQVEPHDFPEG